MQIRKGSVPHLCTYFDTWRFHACLHFLSIDTEAGKVISEKGRPRYEYSSTDMDVVGGGREAIVTHMCILGGGETPWPECVNKLYRANDRRLSAKLVPTFADRRCYVVSVTDPYDRIVGFLDRYVCIEENSNTYVLFICKIIYLFVYFYLSKLSLWLTAYDCWVTSE
jgi:hypothetical protein